MSPVADAAGRLQSGSGLSLAVRWVVRAPPSPGLSLVSFVGVFLGLGFSQAQYTGGGEDFPCSRGLRLCASSVDEGRQGERAFNGIQRLFGRPGTDVCADFFVLLSTASW